MTRRGVVAVAALLAAWSLAGCGSATQRSTTTGPDTTTSATSTPPKSVSKVPPEVAAAVARLKAGDKPDPGGAFTGSGVAVRADGSVQLELHTPGPVTDAQRAELTALGADIVAAGTAVGIVDVWVPFAMVNAVAELPWVVSITVPIPTRAP